MNGQAAAATGHAALPPTKVPCLTEADRNLLRDVHLLRDIFIEAVGPKEEKPAYPVADSLPSWHPPVKKPRHDNSGVDEASGAPQLSSEQINFLNKVEEPEMKLQGLAERVAHMSPDSLVACASLCAELLNQRNISDQHAHTTTWKAALRDQVDHTGHDHEGSSLPTFQAALDKIVATGKSKSDVRDALAAQRVDVVLTAHPTQAQRRTILLKHTRIVELLEEYERVAAAGTPGERRRCTEAIKRELLSAWRTSAIRRSKPTAEGEARNGMAVIEETLWRAVPEHYRRIDRLLQDNDMAPLPADAAPVRISSWMGGDRDGNPNVTAGITGRVVALLRSRAAELYYGEIDTLLFELTHNGPISEEMRALVQASAAAAEDGPERGNKFFTPHSGYGVAKIFQTGVPEDEPYRIVLMALRRRLFKTKSMMDRLYMGEATLEQAGADPDVIQRRAQLLEPLQVMHRSLVAVGDAILAEGALLDLIRRVQTFGLGLSTLDVRQESERHAEALDALTTHLGLGSFLAWDEAQRCAWLETELQSRRPLLLRPRPADFAASANVLEVFDTFAALAQLPAECLGAYVISMAHHASDVLAVALLQKIAGVASPMRIAPLFETREDLQAAPAVMERVLASAAYVHGGKHEVMLGYSDSSKDAGKLASLWELHCAQEKVLAVGHAAGVRIDFFHGRGGSIGRGGGPHHLALLSQPAGSIAGGYRVTVQGEQINAFFGSHGVAVHTLQEYAVSVLEHTLAPPPLPSAAQRALMQKLADESAHAFQQTIYHSAGGTFAQYFHAASPSSALAAMNLGSRPAKRKAQGGIETLRAIPWVFAWTQMRLHLPVWLGGGEALGAVAAKPEGLASLREMYASWPFFKGLVDLVEIEIAKADPSVSALYDAQCCAGDAQLTALGQELRLKLAEAVEVFLAISGKPELLAEQPRARAAALARRPYLNGLHAIQGEAMGRLRKAGAKLAEGSDEFRKLQDAMIVSVQGVAAGMQNTG